MRLACFAFAVAVLLALPHGGSSSTRDLQHVTLIGDSVATGISLDSYAKQILGQGVDLDLEVTACRRLEDLSCPPNPPTAIQLIKTLGPSIGPNVVIAVGYNDYEDRYAGAIDDTLKALSAVRITASVAPDN